MTATAEYDLSTLREMTTTFFAEQAPALALLEATDRVSGFSRGLYKAMADLDFFRLALPTSVGGLGQAADACGTVWESAGYELVSGPWLDQLLSIEMIATQPGCTELLEGLSSGKLLAAVAFIDGGSALNFDSGSNTVSGKVRSLGFADQVDLWVLAVSEADTDGAAYIAVIDPDSDGIVQGPLVQSLDPQWYTASPELASVAPRFVFPWPGDDCVAHLAFAMGLSAAYSIGASQRLLTDAVSYVKQRQQFGKPVGAFQAVKHRAANAFTDLVHTRALVHAALVSGESHQLRLAKVAADRCYRSTAESALQMHGGIGFTAESLVHFFLKNAHRIRDWPESVDTQLETIRRELGLNDQREEVGAHHGI